MNTEFYDFLMDFAKSDDCQKIVVGGIVLNGKGKILVLTRKQDDFLGGIDELPSGNLDAGETICHGLVREIKEETNLDVERIQSYVDFFDYQSRSGKLTRQFNFVIISKKGGQVNLEEHDDYKWQTPEEALLNPNITPNVKRCIRIYAFNKNQKKQPRRI